MFIAVMETGSFTAAAERLGTSSGQASKMVSRLETDLGVRLLNRTTRAVSATQAGKAYFDRLRPLIDEFDSLDASVRDTSQAPRGRVRISAPLTFGTMELAPALNAFAAQYSEIELDVSFTDRVVNLVDEGFDMAVRVGRPDDSSLIARKLCNVRIVVVGASAYLGAQGTPSIPEDLAEHTCIIDTNFRDPEHWPMQIDQTERVQTVSGRIRYSNAEACLGAAEAGLGLACLPAFVAGDAIRTGRVSRVLQPYEIDAYGVHVLYPHSRYLAAKVRVLVDFLAKHFHGKPGWEEGWS